MLITKPPWNKGSNTNKFECKRTMNLELCVNKEELTVSNSVFSSAFKPLLSSYRIVNYTFIFACKGIFYFHKGYFRGHQFLQVRGKGNSSAFRYVFEWCHTKYLISWLNIITSETVEFLKICHLRCKITILFKSTIRITFKWCSRPRPGPQSGIH